MLSEHSKTVYCVREKEDQRERGIYIDLGELGSEGVIFSLWFCYKLPHPELDGVDI